MNTKICHGVHGGPKRAAYHVVMDGWRLRMKSRRKELGIGQESLAERIGVEQSTISGWETGRREPENLELFELLAKNLKCHPAWLLYGVTVDESTQNIGKLSATDRAAVQTLIKSLLANKNSGLEVA